MGAQSTRRFSNNQCKQVLVFHSHQKLTALCDEEVFAFETDINTYIHTHSRTQRVRSVGLLRMGKYELVMQSQSAKCCIITQQDVSLASHIVSFSACSKCFLQHALLICYTDAKYASLKTMSLKVM